MVSEYSWPRLQMHDTETFHLLQMYDKFLFWLRVFIVINENLFIDPFKLIPLRRLPYRTVATTVQYAAGTVEFTTKTPYIAIPAMCLPSLKCSLAY